ncbi:HupE/UreJ family protein [Emticicia sp. 17c]|uniref:HupE/UreJ family protein n=1 Tax=Emticicia sp. 17c TaxID=3127704 RepID=UPI00301BCDA1
MTEFFIFLQLGYQHITDLNGYDHILFVVALCAIYRVTDWKKILVLVTAFTIGHSVTLALAALRVINYSTELIEFLIPVTIIFTCISNLFHKSSESVLDTESFSPLRYILALGFGLIHGMGFSNYLRSLLGKDQNIIPQLLAFNIGLEFGQLMIVGVSMVLSFVILEGFHVKKHTWNTILSSFVAGVAFKLMTEKWFF